MHTATLMHSSGISDDLKVRSMRRNGVNQEKATDIFRIGTWPVHVSLLSIATNRHLLGLAWSANVLQVISLEVLCFPMRGHAWRRGVSRAFPGVWLSLPPPSMGTVVSTSCLILGSDVRVGDCGGGGRGKES